MSAPLDAGEPDIAPILVDQLTRLAARFAPSDRGEGQTRVFDSGLWLELVGLGLDKALLAEERGGFGVSPAQAMSVVRAAAGLALPVPLAETMIAIDIYAGLGGAIPSGPLSWGCEIGVARRVGDSLQVEAEVRAVPYGRNAGHVLVPVRCDDRLHLAAMPVELAVVEANSNLAGEPRDALTWSAARIDARAAPELPQNGSMTLRAAGAFIRSQQMVGAMRRALGHAIDHAQQRRQFGQPIGRFQAVQHMLAEASSQYAAATAAADGASDAYGSASLEFAVAVAKSRVGEAAGVVAATCHQVLGAMGFTREHDLHLVTRRLWAWRDEFGAESFWQELIGRRICSGGGDLLWETVVRGAPIEDKWNPHA